MRSIDPRYFRAFKAVAEAGTFSEAAGLAAMTQANISKHIKALEDQLSSVLFLRTPQGAVITEVGLRLRDYIRHVEMLESRFMSEIRHHSMATSGNISCAMPASCLMLPSVMALCHRQQALRDICVNLHLLPARKVIDRVIDGSVDIGICLERRDQAELSYRPLCKEEYVAAGVPTLDIAGLDAESLVHCRFIHHPEFSFYFHLWCCNFFPDCSDLDARALAYVGKARSIHEAVMMALNGMGISLFPRHCIDMHLRAGTLQEYTQPGVACLSNDLHLVMLKDGVPVQGMEPLLSWFIE
ncbi:LysR family transcriptional regulator [Alcanivorax quisquiliarum]|uniref:LysR family transcriptional regulator n=1 Tax=Alcanivorax quisquiliarum TaxID=2933565 RepID=A0ABT0E511_9GAMM|nr:LysR family transcriptional regulator [Alcanivorax quisquiliarum]